MENEHKQKQKTPGQAFESLCITCSKMERCVSDAKRSLYRWGIPAGEQTKIVEKLIDEKFIDERRYADSYVRKKVAAGRWGASKIIFGLKTKQIPEDIIKQAVASYADGEKIYNKLESELKKRVGKERLKAKNSYDLRTRLFRFAASRGHDFEEINGILDKLIKDEDF